MNSKDLMLFVLETSDIGKRTKATKNGAQKFYFEILINKVKILWKRLTYRHDLIMKSS